MEETILNSFKKFMGKKVEGLDLIVSMPDEESYFEEGECTVMETKPNGKVWNVICSPKGKVVEVYEL